MTGNDRTSLSQRGPLPLPLRQIKSVLRNFWFRELFKDSCLQAWSSCVLFVCVFVFMPSAKMAKDSAPSPTTLRLPRRWVLTSPSSISESLPPSLPCGSDELDPALCLKCKQATLTTAPPPSKKTPNSNNKTRQQSATSKARTLLLK